METSRRDFLKIGSAAALGVAAVGVAGKSASAASGGASPVAGPVNELYESLYPLTLRNYPKPRKIRQTWIKDWPSPSATAVISRGLTAPTYAREGAVNSFGIEQVSIAHAAEMEFLQQNGFRFDGIKMLPAFITTHYDEDYLKEKNRMYALNGSPPRMDHGYFSDLCGHTPQIPFIKKGLQLMKGLGWMGLEIDYTNDNVNWPWAQWEEIIKYCLDLDLEVVFELLDSPPPVPSRGYFTGEEIIGFAEPFLEAGCAYLNIDHRNTERMAGYPNAPRLPQAGWPTVKLEVQKVINAFGWEHLTLESDSNIYPAHVTCFFDELVFGANPNINNIVPNQLMAIDRLRDTASLTPIP